MSARQWASLGQFAGITLVSVVASLVVTGALSAWLGFRMNASVVGVLSAVCFAAVWVTRRER
jgi:hypothetical protein